MKISVYKTTEVLVVAQHYFDKERIIIKHFDDKDIAADFLDQLAKEDTV